jgi:hypothetical protein
MEAQHAEGRTLRIATWNVNGLSRILKNRFTNLENMLASLQAGKVLRDWESSPALPFDWCPNEESKLAARQLQLSMLLNKSFLTGKGAAAYNVCTPLDELWPVLYPSQALVVFLACRHYLPSGDKTVKGRHGPVRTAGHPARLVS